VSQASNQDVDRDCQGNTTRGRGSVVAAIRIARTFENGWLTYGSFFEGV